MFRAIIAIQVAALFSLSVATPVSAAPRENDRNSHKDSYKGSHRVVKHAPLKILPKAHHQVIYKGNPYFYTAGRFYRHVNSEYVVITAPIGAILPSLFGGYATFGVGVNRYFYHEGTYYRSAPTGYVVIKKPT